MLVRVASVIALLRYPMYIVHSYLFIFSLSFARSRSLSSRHSISCTLWLRLCVLIIYARTVSIRYDMCSLNTLRVQCAYIFQIFWYVSHSRWLSLSLSRSLVPALYFHFCFDSYVGVSVHKEFLRKIQVLILIRVRFDWTLKEEWKKNVAADFSQIIIVHRFSRWISMAIPKLPYLTH